MSEADFTEAFRYIAVLPRHQQGRIQPLLLKAARLSALERWLEDKDHQLAYKDQQLEDKDQQLARLAKDKDKQLARLEKDKDQQLATRDKCIASNEHMIDYQYERIVKLEAKLLKTESMHAALTTMRPVLEVYVGLLFPRTTLTVGLEQIANMCVDSRGSKPRLRAAACRKLDLLEGRQVPGIAKALLSLMTRLSEAHHHANQRNGFVCGGDLPVRAATGIALATAQEMLVAQNKLRYADFRIDYCNDAWQVTSSFNDGTITQ